ncbi:restriction endonuclease subunit S [Rodentibacter myodis]|uniref:Restriction endonuclease subunit S n=1 Tax=Rodentibacter myodis TaxID=1907939 RepID=A0A1V3JD99_9PAST|nr:restriction endonuclease subunit S [Rodentibacter myodis]
MWIRLGEIILQNIGGGTPNKSQYEYWNGNISWASVKDLDKDDIYLNETIDKISENGLLNSTSNLIEKNNIILCTRMGLGKIAINNIDVAINQDLRGIILPIYISKLYFIYFYKTLNLQGQGLTVKGLTTEQLNSILFPLPPIAEQHRIVAKIEELLPFIEQYAKKEQELTALHQSFPQQLKKSILQAAIQGKLTEQDPNDEPAIELVKRIQQEKVRLISEKKLKKTKPFSEIVIRDNIPYEMIDGVERCIADEAPFKLPENWCWVRLGDYSFNLDSQRKPVSIEHRSKQSKIYDYYGATGVIDKVEDYIFDGTYVLLGEDGGNFFVNRDTAFIAEGKFWANNHVHVLQVLNNLEKYFCYYLNSLNFPAMGLINGIAVPKLNQKNLNSILIAVPPLEEQHRIVAKIETLFLSLQKLG